jgi:aryl-alcohol dehydrogenase-like predicted oxidoreductase
MEYRQLGASGLTLSAIGLGCNNFGMRIDEPASAAVVNQALESGITHFDTAATYGDGKSEEFLGAALGKRRDDVVVASKFGGAARQAGPGPAPASRRSVVQSCENSLRRLGTDFIDLYYLHRVDPLTPIDETLHALTRLVEQGKVRYIASSNMAGWQIVDADHVAGRRGLVRFSGCQVEWSLLNRRVEREIVPASRAFDVGVVPYFPLASGLLTGKYRRGQEFPADSRLASAPHWAAMATEGRFDRIDQLTALAQTHGHTILDLAIGWLLGQPGVSSVLTGATKPEQVRANVASAAWVPDAEAMAEVAAVLPA